MYSVNEIFDHAKLLPPHERLKLIQELLDTLEPDGEPLSDADWNAAWLPELQSRLAAYERGESQADDWKTVMLRLRQARDTSQSP